MQENTNIHIVSLVDERETAQTETKQRHCTISAGILEESMADQSDKNEKHNPGNWSMCKRAIQQASLRSEQLKKTKVVLNRILLERMKGTDAHL